MYISVTKIKMLHSFLPAGCPGFVGEPTALPLVPAAAPLLPPFPELFMKSLIRRLDSTYGRILNGTV